MHASGMRSWVARAAAGVLAVIAAGAAFATPAVADAGTVTSFDLGFAVFTQGVASGPDGNVWFTARGVPSHKVGKITPDGATMTIYPVSQYSDPRYIAAGPDGNMWFTEYAGEGAIGRISTSGDLTEFPIPTRFNRPWSIAAGPDGNMWFTEDGNKIGRITMAGQITEFPIPTRQSLPDHITAGPDGNMWFTESVGEKLASISPQGHIREYKLPEGSSPSGIVTGPDGHLWITEQKGPGAIARVTVSGSKVSLTEYTAPGLVLPYNIVNGPDGNMWFTDPSANGRLGMIGRITTAGDITLFDSGATRTTTMIDLAAGPGDGKIWFGRFWSWQIANITTG